MFQPLSLFVGLRYVRARTRKFFVSFITWTSLAGVCVGVAALIVILSVMNGLEGDLRDQLVALSAHARVVSRPEEGSSAAPPPAQSDWQAVEGLVRAGAGVVAVSRYVEIQGLAVRTPEMMPILLRGIDPQALYTVEGAEGARSGLAWMITGLRVELGDFQSTILDIKRQ